MTQPAPAIAGGGAGGLARGGALNLVGLVVTGAANFALVAILTRRLGSTQTGVFLTAVGVFTIGQKICEAGAGTGLVRFLSAYRATDRHADMLTVVKVALVPVAVLATTVAAALWLSADTLAGWFADDEQSAAVAQVLRTIAPFLAIAPLHIVMINASRGFGSMKPQVVIERLGRSLMQPVSAFVVISFGGGVRVVALCWAASFAVTILPTALVLMRLVRRASDGALVEALPTQEIRSEFWRFTLPRSGGQFFEVGVQWADTLVVGAVVGTAAAGVYAAGSRFLLLAIYVADALIQAISPRLSAMLAARRNDEASDMLSTATVWQVLLVWPTFLLVFTYASVFLSLLGDDLAAAETALRWLSVAALVAALNGPSVAIVLMGGRSDIALINTAVAFAVNIGGNLLLVPHFGISGAGATWAATIVISSSLPALEANKLFGVQPWSRAIPKAAFAAVATVGGSAVLGRLALGDTFLGMSASAVLGGGLYLSWIYLRGDEYRLRELIRR